MSAQVGGHLCWSTTTIGATASGTSRTCVDCGTASTAGTIYVRGDYGTDIWVEPQVSEIQYHEEEFPDYESRREPWHNEPTREQLGQVWVTGTIAEPITVTSAGTTSVQMQWDTSSDTLWTYGHSYGRRHQEELTPEQERQRRVQQKAVQRRMKREAKEKAKIDRRANKLLKEWLSPAEYNYLMEEGQLELPSQYEKNVIYIVRKDPNKTIGIARKKKQVPCLAYEDTILEKEACMHIDASYPTGDRLLANIMLLKADEKYFVKNANVSPVNRRMLQDEHYQTPEMGWYYFV